MPFFRGALGFDAPARRGVADFLQEVALPSDQQARWAAGLGGGRGRAAAAAARQPGDHPARSGPAAGAWPPNLTAY